MFLRDDTEPEAPIEWATTECEDVRGTYELWAQSVLVFQIVSQGKGRSPVIRTNLLSVKVDPAERAWLKDKTHVIPLTDTQRWACEAFGYDHAQNNGSNIRRPTAFSRWRFARETT